jgi:5-formyltetrahydrofolate cyclo-ligase
VPKAVDDIRAQKDALRQRLRAERNALDPERARAASAAVCRRVLALPAIARARTVTLYAAIQREIDVAEVARALLARGVRVAYPRIDDPRLAFHAVTSLDELEPDVWKIPTPRRSTPVVPSAELDVLIVPGLAFDAGGHRLGYGRGYYDGELAAAPQAVRVGVAHAFQLVDPLPVQVTDQPVDILITELGARATGARPHIGPLEVST